MSFRVAFYTFSKRENSTARPPSESGAIYLECDALYPTGVLSPRVVVETGENPTAWNYAYINQFNRYYFVTEWTADNGFWVASLDVDPLATYKEEIGAADLYVLRSSAAQDGTYTDTLYPMGNDAQRVTDAHNTLWASTFTKGWFVVGVVGPGGDQFGVSYYVYTAEQFSAFCDYLFANIDWLSLDAGEIGEGLAKSLINPFQYVVSCTWFPVKPPTSLYNKDVDYGWWKVPTECYSLSPFGSDIVTQTFTKTAHPQSGDRGMYLNAAPYTELALEIAPFGKVELNATAYADVQNVFAQIDVDFISGEAVLKIYPGTSGGSGAVCTNYLVAQLGVSFPISQMGVDVRGAVNSVAGAVNGIGSLNALGSIASVGSAITSLALPTLQTTGGIKGTMATMAHDWKLHTTCWPVPEDDNDHRGRPLLKNRTPSSLGGYILAADGDIEAPATASELAAIKSAIENGFFYE